MNTRDATAWALHMAEVSEAYFANTKAMSGEEPKLASTEATNLRLLAAAAADSQRMRGSLENLARVTRKRADALDERGETVAFRELQDVATDIAAFAKTEA